MTLPRMNGKAIGSERVQRPGRDRRSVPCQGLVPAKLTDAELALDRYLETRRGTETAVELAREITSPSPNGNMDAAHDGHGDGSVSG